MEGQVAMHLTAQQEQCIKQPCKAWQCHQTKKKKMKGRKYDCRLKKQDSHLRSHVNNVSL